MKYSIDRIENNIVVLECIYTKEIIYVDKKNLPDNIKETDILSLDEDGYKIDFLEKKGKINLLKSKMSKLKKNQE